MHPMKPHLRHYIGPYSDGNDYFVFIIDEGDGIRTHHRQAHQVAYDHLTEADVVFKLPSGAHAIVDEFTTASFPDPTCADDQNGGTCARHYDRSFSYEIHKSQLVRPERFAASAKAGNAGSVPLAELGKSAGGSGVAPMALIEVSPIPTTCSKSCPSGPSTISCPPGTTKKCNPVTGVLYCDSGEG